MKRSLFLVLAVFAAALVCVNCSEASLGESEEYAEVSIKAVVGGSAQAQSSQLRSSTVDVGTLVQSAMIKLTRGAIVKYVPMTINGDQATATVSGLLVGMWHAAIQMHDADGLVIYSGTTDFRVHSGAASNVVTLTLVRHQGDAIFDFTLPHENSDIDPNMILWNKMESAAGLLNSVVGPAFGTGSAYSFGSGRFGNGVFVSKNGELNQRLTIAPGTFNLSKFSIEFHVQRGSVESGQLYGALFTSSTENEAFQIQSREGYGGQYRTFVYLKKGDKECYYQIDHGNAQGSLDFLPRMTWVHLAVAVDTTAAPGSKIKMYRNGVQVPLVPFSAASDSEFDATGNNANPVYVLSHFSGNDLGYNGAIDNIKMYNYQKDAFAFGSEY